MFCRLPLGTSAPLFWQQNPKSPLHNHCSPFLRACDSSWAISTISISGDRCFRDGLRTQVYPGASSEANRTRCALSSTASNLKHLGRAAAGRTVLIHHTQPEHDVYRNRAEGSRYRLTSHEPPHQTTPNLNLSPEFKDMNTDHLPWPRPIWLRFSIVRIQKVPTGHNHYVYRHVEAQPSCPPHPSTRQAFSMTSDLSQPWSIAHLSPELPMTSVPTGVFLFVA